MKLLSNLDLNNGAQVVNSPVAVSAGDLTPLSQVQSLIAAATLGVAKGTAVAATTGALPSNTYNNGSAGVGATITSTANIALPVQDGITLTVGQVLLVKNEATAANNGLYTVTQVGSGSVPFILTRATNFDQASEMTDGSWVLVANGTTLNGTIWILNSAVTTVGTDPVSFTIQTTVVAGTGISVTLGNTVNVKYDTATLGINGSGNLYVLDISANASAVAFNNTSDWSTNDMALTALQIGLGTGAMSVYVEDSTGALVLIDNVQTAGACTLTKATAASVFAGTAIFVAA